MNAVSTPQPSAGWLTWLWLLIGVLLLPFTAYQGVVALAAWIAPVFLLRFVRTSERGRLALFLVFLAYAGAALIDMRGSPTGGSILTLIVSLAVFLPSRGLAYMLPYAADRLIGRHHSTWVRLFVFPAAFVAVDWVLSLLKVTGTFGSPAYSQMGDLPLMQLISITGMWGLTFLIMWFATSVNALWEHDFRWRPVRAPIGVFAVALVGVFVFGTARLAVPAPASPTLQVATVTIDSALLDAATSSVDYATFYGSTDAQRAAVRPAFAATVDQMLARTETALRRGAKLVGWQEDGAQVLAEDVPGVLARASALAKQYDAYLQLGLQVYARTSGLPYMRDQSILIDPSGSVLATYEKTYPVFPSEWLVTFPGPGELPVVSSPYGSLSTAICNDMGYPGLLRQAGANGVDILFAPTHSIFAGWAASDTAEATYRTIENGFVLVRATGNGPSLALDPEGRVLASQDYTSSTTGITLARVPTQGVATIYSHIGDLFAYLCLLGLATLTAYDLVRGRRAVRLGRLRTA